MTATVSMPVRDHRVSTAPSFRSAVGAVAWRGWLRTKRNPAIMVQTIFFPTFFLLVYSGLYGPVTDLPGFPTSDVNNWFLPFMLLQGAAFSGVGAGFATAFDIDSGFFDRLLLMPARRIAILVGTILFAFIRTAIVSVAVAALGMALGAFPTDWVGIPLLILAIVLVSAIASAFSLALIYRVKDPRIAPLFSIGIFMTLFVSTAQVPLVISTGWLHLVARFNPMTNILRLARQPFLDSGVTWANTWGGLVALAMCVVGFMWWAARGLANFNP